MQSKDYSGNRLQWKFLQTCGRTHLQHSSPHDDRGKFCSLGTSSLLASGLINVSYSANRTHQSPREKDKCASLRIMLGFPAFILVFYFHSVNLFCFLGKLTTGRPLPHGLPQGLSLPPLRCPSSGGGGLTSHLFFFLLVSLFINLVISLFVYLLILIFIFFFYYFFLLY